jgi:hypothetical protein
MGNVDNICDPFPKGGFLWQAILRGEDVDSNLHTTYIYIT